jgi:hypothetical protein
LAHLPVFLAEFPLEGNNYTKLFKVNKLFSFSVFSVFIMGKLYILAHLPVFLAEFPFKGSGEIMSDKKLSRCSPHNAV